MYCDEHDYKKEMARTELPSQQNLSQSQQQNENKINNKVNNRISNKINK
jgi:hypothetical protein